MGIQGGESGALGGHQLGEGAGRGLRPAGADIAPELFTLDRHGFPVVGEGPVSVWLTPSAKRAVNRRPALALRFAASSR
ncbi:MULTISPECIES: hypothetical protein [Kitasatospora]|uniref:Uncharacterized protein n=1 Tax=Kitasatospora cathayae TaxID=3004092 RepID=A0ABY7Q1X7_9ACTN|nr:hypothetical protein [Kitasatospora sp. HUAS 3-15]WBP86166.1 hypothetical protein O1G21_10140 [Kitasatospora sp. HUAS 3-15]